MEHQDHTTTTRVSVGIDVSKETLDACLMQPGKSPVYGKFKNNGKGHIQLLKWAKRMADGAAIHFCMEATGAYSDACATYLAQAEQTVSVVNPHKIHYWAISKGQGNKTDKADARAIAEYCLKEEPALWRMAAPEVRELIALVRHLDNLQQHATQQKNRLSEPGLPDAVTKSLMTLLTQIETEIANVDRLIKKHIDSHPKLRHDRDLLVSIPGIGEKTAAMLLAELPDVDLFHNTKVAAKYAGLSPSQYQSGTSVWKRTRIYVGGKRRLRSALYMPAMSAIQHNPLIQRLYIRLTENGHKGASALAAAMRKLLMIAVGVLKSQVPFRADYLETARA